MKPRPLRLGLITLALLPVGVATLAFSGAAPSPVAMPAVLGASDPILAVHAGSLTTYLPTTATGVQDIQPRIANRGVNVDGTLRAAPGHSMAIHGNPFEQGFGGARAGLVDLWTGAPEIFDVDLALPSEGLPWAIGRTYNPRQLTSGAAHRDSDGPQGKNWFQMSQPEILLFEHASDDYEDVLYLVYGADRFLEYQRVDTGSGASATTFRGKNGAAGVFLYAAGATNEPDTFTLTDQGGNEWTFFGFDGDAGAAAGQFWKAEDNAGNVSFVGDASTGSTAISSGYSGGKITTAYDASDRRYTYTYTTLDSVDRLTQVKAETKTGGTWASPTGVATVGKVDYGYYTAESYGDPGDLKLVTITTPLSDSGVELVSKKYYRYWEGTYNSVTNPGYPHCLQYIVGFEGTRNHDWQDTTFDEDFLTESEANLKPYAEAYFEWDTSYRVNEAWFNGNCGCSGANNGTHEFSYATNGLYSDSAGYTDAWAARTVLAQPDGSFLTQYFDEAGQALTRVVSDDDPTGSPDFWVTYVDRDADGMLAYLYTPASVASYTHSTGAVTLNSSAGLVTGSVRETTGATKHFVLNNRWRTGSSGTAYFDGAQTYATTSVTVGDDAVTRPVIASTTAYTEQIVSGSSGAVTTSYATTFYSSSLRIEKVVTTLPAVSTSKNGSGSTDTRSVYLDTQGRTTFAKATDGIISYREYTDGQVTKSIQDADTTKSGVGEDFNGVTIPSGFASSGTPLHRVTEMTHDAQGRSDEVLAFDGRIAKSYYSRLADHRSVSIGYADYEASPEKFFGPASYSVSNQAGKSEASGTIAYSGGSTTTGQTSHIDETDDDPVTAVDTGSLATLAVQLYNESGYRLDESQAFFAIPSMLPGTDGTHYDPTKYAYDSMGRQIRTLAAHGTIQRSVFDAIGRRTEAWVGTNDYGEEGGSVSGTNNMTRVSATVYDGGSAGGNSFVTQVTAYEDSTTGNSTSYQHDVRGRVLLETRPTSPHALHEYDNLGRRIASAQYSSTGSIVVGTDSPQTETTNRLALNKSFYDERGQVWKTTRHKIDVSDGSDDDNLASSTWRDSQGRVLRVDGSQLAKTAYDRIGRATRQYVLATSDDTVYSDADDVTGDIVMEERQTIYEDDDVVMTVRIDREHDDFGGSETTGPLDTNADGDDMEVTAANLKGRAQITSFWHDRFGRTTDSATYGTNGGSDYDRSASSSAPASADNNPVRTTAYSDEGRMESETDPLGRVTYREYDALGRLTKEVRNYDVSVNSGNPSGAEDNQTVRYEFTDGLQTKIIADVPSGGTDQETVYTYGTTKGASAGDSKFATGHLLQEVEYPDSASASDVVSYAYDAQGRQIWMEDQAGNITETEYDASGRAFSRAVTTLASGFDGAVRRIETAYDDLGRRETVTQYDTATSGSVTDEVEFGYDGWSNVTTFQQDVNSAVGASGSVDDYEVSHTYEKATGGRNTVRRTATTLPSGNVLTYIYPSTSGLHHDDLSRVGGIQDGAVVLVRYSYNGVGQVVEQKYSTIDLYSQVFDSGGAYSRLDRFNRTTDFIWDNPNGYSAYDVDLTWDRAGNITSVVDNVHGGFDNLYTIDELDRVTRAHQGTLSGGSITSATQDQQWTLDHLGNWEENRLDLDGDGSFTGTDELDEDRSHNDVNEITARDIDGDSSDDYTLTYDAVGQLTDDGEEYKYVWDAFGRMRKILDRSDDSLVEELRYNGLGFMIGEHYDADEDLDVDGSDPWYFHAFDERWRQVATFREGDSDPKEEWVCQQAGLDGAGGASFINGIVLRDRDDNSGWTSAADGTLEQRIFYSQNWRGDVVALTGSGGYQVEQVRYSAYGVPFGLPGGDLDSDGDCDSSDAAILSALVGTSGYDSRGDLNCDGTCDSMDSSVLSSSYLGLQARLHTLSLVDNRNADAGAISLLSNIYSIRNERWRLRSSSIGQWLRRDPLGYWDGLNAYVVMHSNAIVKVDPSGLSDFVITEVVGHRKVKLFGDVWITLPIVKVVGTGSKREPNVACEELWEEVKKVKPDADPCNPLEFKSYVGGYTACHNGTPTYCNWTESMCPGNLNGMNEATSEAYKAAVTVHEDKHLEPILLGQCTCDKKPLNPEGDGYITDSWWQISCNGGANEEHWPYSAEWDYINSLGEEDGVDKAQLLGITCGLAKINGVALPGCP